MLSKSYQYSFTSTSILNSKHKQMHHQVGVKHENTQVAVGDKGFGGWWYYSSLGVKHENTQVVVGDKGFGGWW